MPVSSSAALLKLSELPAPEIASRLKNGDLLLKLPPFVARLKSNIAALARDIALVYRDFDTVPPDTFADYHVEVSFQGGVRRWVRPLARFYFDGRPAFLPLPAHQALPMLEWGLNWCVAAHAHQFLIIHAAVIERGGKAAILPAPPGAGKSTLCAGLVNRGWRLMSDELALCDLSSGLIYGMARPLNLKNASIEIIQRFAPDAVMTAPVPNTTKGTVALMRPPADSVRRVQEPARPAWIVLPNYTEKASSELAPYSPAQAFMLIAEQSFNYDIHGRRGFDAVAQLVDQCSCHKFTYGNLSDAEDTFSRLLEEIK